MRIRIALTALAAGLQLSAQDRPTIVSTDWLAQHLNDPNVVVLHMVRDSTDYRMGHIPGAREVQYPSIITTRDSIGAELPPPDQLRQVFERLGVSDNSHVVIYSGMTGIAPAASRAFLSLDYLGHRNVSLLSGGIVRWKAEKRPVSTDVVTPTPGPPGDTLVTYCLVGYRGSMTYFGARLAGLPVKLYDGSYQDWSRRMLPVVKGASP